MSEQPALPGLEHLGPQFEAHKAQLPLRALGKVSEQWSGPIPGQTVIDMQGGRTLPTDQHGNVYAPRHDLAHLLTDYGGGLASEDPHVQAHWARQPLHQVRADTPIETTQHWHETSDPNNEDAGDEIRKSLASGEPIKKPVWLARSKNRLYALDGHTRMLAAREAGLSHYPAHVWDLDTTQKAGRS
jgi:hypothetical protein